MAQTDLGWMYANGRGVEKDDVESAIFSSLSKALARKGTELRFPAIRRI